jgi:hypothetical protein
MFDIRDGSESSAVPSEAEATVQKEDHRATSGEAATASRTCGGEDGRKEREEAERAVQKTEGGGTGWGVYGEVDEDNTTAIDRKCDETEDASEVYSDEEPEEADKEDRSGGGNESSGVCGENAEVCEEGRGASIGKRSGYKFIGYTDS